MKPINANEISGAVIQHLSSESYQKLNRARNVAFHMHLLIRHLDGNVAPLLRIPDIFSYIAGDISDISEELKAKGLFDPWLQQEHDEIDNA